MKKSDLYEPSELNIERSPAHLAFWIVFTLVLDYYVYYLFRTFSPLLFLLIVPAAVISFHTLWVLLNPYALVFKDRVEFKYSLFTNKKIYFSDIKKLARGKDGRLFLVYTDDEAEPLKLSGIKASHIPVLKQEIEKKLEATRV